jgi:capsular polysaccharide biosynthesis protein
MWDKKWVLIILSLIACIVSIFVSLQITPRYRSQVILFPAASIALSKNLVETTTITMDGRDLLSFGADPEAERMLQILHSNQIMDHIIRKFDLMKHYQVNPASAYPKNQLENMYKGNVKIRRTEFMSIEIGVLDTDPQMAADIANEIAAYVDSTVHNMQKERATEAFAIVEKEYQQSQLEIRQFNDTLQQIRRLGVTDYESQAAAYNKAYANALEQGNNGAAESILKKMNILTTYGGKYVELSQKLRNEIDRLGQLKAKVASFKVYVDNIVPQIFIVDKAVKDEHKALPKRSIIVMISTLSTFALTLLLLLIADNLKVRK